MKLSWTGGFHRTLVGDKYQEKQPSLRWFSSETVLLVRGEQRIYKPWGVGKNLGGGYRTELRGETESGKSNENENDYNILCEIIKKSVQMLLEECKNYTLLNEVQD